MAQVSNIKIKNNMAQFRRAAAQQIANALEAIGGEAERHAKEECPVDTGRLRNSITFATSKMQSEANTNRPYETKSNPQDAEPQDYKMHGTPKENTVYVGTNVEYAPMIEMRSAKHTTGRAHFLRDSVSTHGDEYRAILEAALKS